MLQVNDSNGLTPGWLRFLRRYWVFAPVLILAFALGLSSLLRQPNAAEVEKHRLHAAGQLLQEQASYNIERRFAGRVAASQDADVGFELAGRVSQLLVNDGDRVQAGQVLAKLDTELLVAERAQLLAQLDDTKARQLLNTANIKRHQSLQASGFASQQRLDELETEQKTLTASLDALTANLDSVDSRLRKANLKAPYSGVVARRFVDQGMVVNAGSPVLRLQESGAMEAAIGVPVTFALNLTAGQLVPLSLRGNIFEARIITVGSDVSPVTNTVNVRLLLPQNTSAFNGDLIQLVMTESVQKTGFWIAADAITDGVRGRWTVYVLVKESDGVYRVEARDIQIEHMLGDRMFASGALADGELIVANGVHRVVPGQLVSVNLTPEADAEGATSVVSEGQP
ncbi:efflux RND transporter periplasmic adaptor subunit [Simiduia litorea]|uniref:efflux RND transporter periplasmic adaptor subunit n=1 Tax=Simiduia litorea TaxID=1435348 RepID=UPI0036F342AF